MLFRACQLYLIPLALLKQKCFVFLCRRWHRQRMGLLQPQPAQENHWSPALLCSSLPNPSSFWPDGIFGFFFFFKSHCTTFLNWWQFPNRLNFFKLLLFMFSETLCLFKFFLNFLRGAEMFFTMLCEQTSLFLFSFVFSILVHLST